MRYHALLLHTLQESMDLSEGCIFLFWDDIKYVTRYLSYSRCNPRSHSVSKPLLVTPYMKVAEEKQWWWWQTMFILILFLRKENFLWCSLIVCPTCPACSEMSVLSETSHVVRKALKHEPAVSWTWFLWECIVVGINSNRHLNTYSEFLKFCG